MRISPAARRRHRRRTSGGEGRGNLLRTTRKTRLAGLAAAAVAGGTAAASGVRLELRGYDGRQLYRMKNTDTAKLTGPGGYKKHMKYETTSSYFTSAVELGNGTVELVTRPSTFTLKVNGKPVPSLRALGRVRVETKSPRGETLGQAKRTDPGDEIFPVFPAAPVAVGASWSTQSAPTENFSLPIRLTHTLVEIKEVMGHRCAIIKTTGGARGVDQGSGARVSFQVVGRLAWGLDEGILVRQKGRAHSLVRYPQPLQDGQQQVRKTSETLLEMWPLDFGAAVDPGAEGGGR